MRTSPAENVLSQDGVFERVGYTVKRCSHYCMRAKLTFMLQKFALEFTNRK
jgi:hypothetical protein